MNVNGDSHDLTLFSVEAVFDHQEQPLHRGAQFLVFATSRGEACKLVEAALLTESRPAIPKIISEMAADFRFD